MGKYRQIHTSFWEDPLIMELEPVQKSFYLYLMTNPKTTQCGIYELPIKIIEFHTGLKKDAIEELLLLFESKNKIRYSRTTHEIFILNWLKYNPPKGESTRTRVERELSEVKFGEFLEEFGAIAQKLGHGFPNIAKCPPSPPPIGGGDSLNKEQCPPSSIENYSENDHVIPRLNTELLQRQHPVGSDIAERLALKLLEHLNAIAPRANKPSQLVATWVSAFESFLAKDDVNPDEIANVMDWVFGPDNWWRGKILNAKAFIDKYNTLSIQMQVEKTKGKKSGRFDAVKWGGSV